ncbi:hypothetical protein N7478_003739 [Penicillium angulare]|uniref:uncharacterized protein n=1 Tax=Penicillium angulare TaxID=116970 RepID=UPI0025404FCC|nr:uncharacterized protein N7478_003739 [Penicillium angulare]KAJ5288053.1 hypothetical protein N7478_003739 [Penicillium angulare]
MVEIDGLMALVKDWFADQIHLDFQVEFNDVAEYAEQVLLEVKGTRLNEELCQTLNASLLEAPGSVTRKLLEKSEDQTQYSVEVVIQLIVNGHLPPAKLCHSILSILLGKQGNCLTDYLLESQESTAILAFKENLGQLLERAFLALHGSPTGEYFN